MPKVKMDDFTQNDYSAKSDYPWWRETDSGSYLVHVATEHGLVAAEIYSRDNFTKLEFAWNGRLYARSWQRAWGKKTAVRLAREFAQQVALEND